MSFSSDKDRWPDLLLLNFDRRVKFHLSTKDSVLFCSVKVNSNYYGMQEKLGNPKREGENQGIIIRFRDEFSSLKEVRKEKNVK